MKFKKSLFLHLFYTQLFSTTASSLNRYHLSKQHCFDSVLNSANSALLIQPTPDLKSNLISLPILDSLSLLPATPSKKFSFQTFQQNLKNVFSFSDHDIRFFESHYFRSSYIKSLSKFPFQSYQKLSKTTCPADIHPFLDTVTHHLAALNDTYDTTIFWASNDHKRYLKRVLDKANTLKKSPTVDLVDNFLSLIPTLLIHIQESSNLVYKAETDHPDSFSQDFEAWNHYLTSFFILFRAIIQTFLITSFYKLHYFTILLHSLSKSAPDTESNSLSQLIKELQTKLVHNLCFQQGYLADLLSGLQSLIDSHSSYSTDLTSFSSEIKQSYFDVKHLSIDYLSKLKQLSVKSWVDYFNACFTNKISHLSLSIITEFYDLFSTYEFSEVISDHIISSISSIESLSHSLPDSVQNQSNLSLKVSHSLYSSLQETTQSLYQILFWASILSLYLSKHGRYSLMSECCMHIYQNLPGSIFNSNFIAYFSVLLKPYIFQHYIDYLTQLYPQNMLNIINASISLYPTQNSISLQYDDSFITWYNSTEFINRWIASFRSSIFHSSSDTWKYLYPYMSYFFISTAPLIKDWINYAATHHLERDCLIRMIHYISTHTPNDVRLYNIFIRTRHLNLDINELQKIQLSYSLSDSTLHDYISHIQYLYNSDNSQSLYAIDLLSYQLINYCESLHANYSADVVVQLIHPHISSFMFILCIHLKHQLPSLAALINFLGIYYSLYEAIYDPMDTLFSEYLGVIEDVTPINNILLTIQKEIPNLSKPFLSYLLTYFESHTSVHANQPTVHNFDLSVSQTYLSLSDNPLSDSVHKSTSLSPRLHPTFHDPFYLVLGITPLLIDAYHLMIVPNSNSFQLSELKVSIEEWFISHQSQIENSLNISLSKSVKLLIQHAIENHTNQFLSQRKHLISLLFSLKSISFFHKLLLSHIINLSSCLVDLDQGDITLYSPSLYSFDFDSIDSKAFLLFCLETYKLQFDMIPSFSFSEFDGLTLQKLFSQFKHTVVDFEEIDFIFLEQFMVVLKTSIMSLSDHATADQNTLFSLLNKYYDYLDTISVNSPFFNSFLYKFLPLLNPLLEFGFINYFHPFFAKLISLHDQHPHPPESLVSSSQFLIDYQLLISCLSLNTPMNFNLFEAIIQKPYINHSLHYIFSDMSGMCLNFSLFLLTHTQELSADDHDHGICFFLNKVFNQDLNLLQWQQSYFFFHLLKTFYSYSQDSHQLDHMMGLSLKSQDKLIISSLLLKSPQQAKQLILRLQDLSQSSHPLLKNVMISLLDYSLETHLNDPLLTLKSISNDSLRECLIIKSEIDHNITHIFQQLSRLVTTFSQQSIRPQNFQTFILKASMYLNAFPSSKPYIKNLDIHSPLYINQLIHIIRIITELHSTLSDITHDSIQHLCRHLCHIIAKILLDPIFVNTFDSYLLDYFFSTHQALLLDELKTIIVNQNSISFQQVHSILSLLEQSPQQLSYSRFSQWFLHLDILSYADDTDLSMILYECSLLNQDIALDIIKAQKKPISYLEIIIEQNKPLSFCLLYLLHVSSIESDQTLFSDCLLLLKKDPLLSYFSMSTKSHHPAHNFITYIYKPNDPSLKSIAASIQALLPNHLDSFTFYLELLFLNQPELFWILCQHNHFDICDSIIELVQRSHNESLPSFSITPLSRWLANPFFLNKIALLLEKSCYDSVPPLFIHSAILHSPSAITSFSEHDIVNWIYYCTRFNQLIFCFDLLKSRDYHSADSFYFMFLCPKNSLLSTAKPSLFLDYLDYLDDITLASFISKLEERFHVSYHDFSQFLLGSLPSSSDHHSYSKLLIRCTPYLMSLHNKSTNQPLSDTYIIAYSSLCYVNDLSISEICQLLKQCNFIPSLIIPNHVINLSNAIFDPSYHHFFTDLSLHYTPIFHQLFFTAPFTKVIQQAVYYNELTTDTLLYNHIIKALDSFNYIHLMQFLALYSNKHLTSQKQALCHDLLDSFLPFSSENVRNNFDELETSYKDLVNTPIPQLSVKDPILSLIFKKLSHLRQNLHVTEQLYCFLAANPQELAQHGIDSIHIKKQLEICCNDGANHLLLLSYFYHPSDHKSLHLFSNFINNWEDKQSLYDSFTLNLQDDTEHYLMYDYLLFMSRIVTRFSFKQFKLSPFKQICSSLHFLLTYAPDKTYLHQWVLNCLIPNMKSSYFSYLAPVFSSKNLDQNTISLLAKGFINQQKTACYAPLFKACFLQPTFCDIWEHFISVSKEHIILSDLLVETSPLHMSVEVFLRNFIEDQPKSFFHFCSSHYKYEIFIDIFFKKLYDHYFSSIIINDTITTLTATNPFMKLTEQALRDQEFGFLFFLARCIEHYIIPNNKNISWFIQLLNNLYHIPLATLPNNIDPSIKNTISKLFLNAGIILDTGELIQDLPTLNLDQLALLNSDIKFTPPIEFAFVNLQQTSISFYQQRHHCLDILSQEAPSFFIRETSILPTLNQNLGITFFQEDPSYLDYLLNLLFISGFNSLALQEFCINVSHNTTLKSKFFNYIQKLPTDLLSTLITHPKLSINQRHLILYGLLHDEKGCYNTDNNNAWESRVVNTLLTDLISPWLHTMNVDDTQTNIEIILFFLIHFPSAVQSICTPYFTPIFNKTGICFPKLFACKDQLEILFSKYHVTLLDLDTLVRIMNELFDTGYTLFELVIAFRSSSLFTSELENEWISLYLEAETPYTITTIPSWFINIYNLVCIKQKLIYVADSFFESSIYHQAFKRWLIDEGHLTEHNMLSLFSLEDFLSFYDPYDIYAKLIDDISSIIAPQSITSDMISRLAEPFFESLFFHLKSFSLNSTIHVTEFSLLINLLSVPTTHYEKSFLLDQLHSFEHALYSHNLVSLLNVSYIPFVMALLQSSSHTISNAKKDALLDSLPLILDLTHSLFDSLSKKRKASFHSFLIDHSVLNKRCLNMLNLELLKQDPAKLQEHYEAFTLLDKYLITHRTLLESALVTVAQLGFILLYPFSIARTHFSNLFASIHDYEWIYITHFLKQSINNVSIESMLQNVIGHTSSLSKDRLKQFALNLKESSSTETTLESLFLDFQKHTSTHVSSPHLPTVQSLLNNLMISISNQQHCS
ncbi:hypothetical protein CL658_01415 [bacterium]|nr:hypothetical protein [bacterium]|tara:strand:+ start:48680 stop:57919 length:9240 start_codon:yes stop_codon:yes gene_type:complete